jgi:tetratricopeptide (TPR) repeat protein
VQRNHWMAEGTGPEEETPSLFDFDEEEAEALPAYDPEGGVSKAASAPGPLEWEEEAEPLPLLEDPYPQSVPEEKVEGAVEDATFEAALAEDEGDRRPGKMEGAPPTSHAAAAQEGDLDLAMELVRAEIEGTPDQLELYQRQVEYAFRKGEAAFLVPAYLDLARYLLRTGSPTKARAVFQQVLSLDPGNADAASGLGALGGETVGSKPAEVASSEEYVDLGSMILGDVAEKTTRWQVTADSPSGDDQADFRKMLTQFKEKVSEHVDADDVSAHRDLGTAYLEMGLVDEAIGEFQQALRTAPNHLPTHELMGRCWMEKGQPDMAVRALRRALTARFDVEDELIGIYYTMGRAQEELGNTTEAVEFYEKVFSLDINFQDVTERLRSLR